jgi:hypothetical protein
MYGCEHMIVARLEGAATFSTLAQRLQTVYLAGMTALRKQQMSVDEFVTWARQQTDRWELLDGLPVAMSPERVVHGDVKYRVALGIELQVRDLLP